MSRTRLDGVKMLHHDEMRNYARIQSKMLEVLMKHGCKIVEPPSFADYDIYGQFFPHLRREMVKTIDADGSVLVLRPDATLPIVETAAREFPRTNQLLKFGYVSTVFRKYSGRSTYGKDFLQGGAEILGDPEPECDGEIIAMAAAVLAAVGICNIHIDIGTAAYAYALFDELFLDKEAKQVLRRYLGERNLVAYRGYTALLPLRSDCRRALDALPVLFGPYAETLTAARTYCLNSGMRNALARLEKTHQYLGCAGYTSHIRLDLGVTDPLGYYTDMMFKIYADEALCELVSGGRYDRLSTAFGIERPACGFGMNLNLLYEFMSDAGLLKDAEPSLQLAVSYSTYDRQLLIDLFNWRRRGFRVAAYPDTAYIDAGDCRLCCRYGDGVYHKDGNILTARELEEFMRRCDDGSSYCPG